MLTINWSDDYTRWQSLIRDIIIMWPEVHNIGPDSRTPLTDLIADYIFYRNVFVPFRLMAGVPRLLDLWLSCLVESGVDLELYGRKEVELHEQGLVSWVFNNEDPRFPPYSHALRILTYGPTPNDWKLSIDEIDHVQDENNGSEGEEATESVHEEVAENRQGMPGSWVDDG